MLVTLNPLQARVIGVLLEKELTTPEQYPLSLNALTLGCNQKSSRDPIMHLGEPEVQGALNELRDMRLLFEHQGSGSRVVKYKHRFCNTEFSSLQFTPQQFAIICVLLLRGPQTPGQLRTRTNRLCEFANVNEVEATLVELAHLNGETLVTKLEREPGKRESRYVHMFSDNETIAQYQQASHSPQSSTETLKHAENDTSAPSLLEALQRIESLESKVAALELQLSELL